MKTIHGYNILDFYRLDIDKERFKAKKSIIDTQVLEKGVFYLSRIISQNLQSRYLWHLDVKKILPKEQELPYLIADELRKAWQPKKDIPKVVDFGKGNLIIELSKEDTHEYRGNFAEFLKHEFDVDIAVYKYATALALSCDLKETKKILDILNNKDKYSLKSHENYNFSRARESFIFKIPEGNKFLARKRKINEKLWNLEDVQAYETHMITKGQGVTVAVIDTGVDYNHPELASRFGSYRGHDFVRGSKDPYDFHGHGTHVSGTIAGTNVGVAPGCNLLAYRVLDEYGSGSEADVVSAIEMAIDDGADEISMSLGGPDYSQPLQDVCSEAHNRGVLVVAAAGNDASTNYSYPASLEGVVSVAATDNQRKQAYFSNMNDMVDIAAPGVDIYSTIPNNEYGLMSGTSMATPHVSGVAALIKSVTKQSSIELEKLIKDSALKIGDQDPLKYGFGLIQSHDALVR